MAVPGAALPPFLVAGGSLRSGSVALVRGMWEEVAGVVFVSDTVGCQG